MMWSNFFDLENRYDLLDELWDSLLRLAAVIDCSGSVEGAS